MNTWIDAHHHLWDLSAVYYPWLMARGVKRFFGNPTPIQKNYLLETFREEAGAMGVGGSVHIQVGAEDGMAEARWVQAVADANPAWPMVQVVFCDLTAPDLVARLDACQALLTVRGVRQIIGRSPAEDAQTGTQLLLENPRFLAGLKEVAARGLRFDLQLFPQLMHKTAHVLEQVPELPVALCHAGSPFNGDGDGLRDWEAQLKHLSQLPSITCKLSGLGMFNPHWSVESIRPIVDICLAQFGASRCMFGSNFPVDRLYSSYERLFKAYCSLLPQALWDTLFGQTARQFYGLHA